VLPARRQPTGRQPDRAEATGDDSGTGPNGDQTIPVSGPDKGTSAAGTLNPLSIGDPNDPGNHDIDDIAEFLKVLTDVREQCDRAPFDHPELLIPVGHKPADQNRDSRADDIVFRLPELWPRLRVMHPECR
jgi:hypothetical protein